MFVSFFLVFNSLFEPFGATLIRILTTIKYLLILINSYCLNYRYLKTNFNDKKKGKCNLINYFKNNMVATVNDNI